ncbi:hypothetical protein BDF14DRAFT_1823249 [Spinellus fusiger]|nr:hypothetical protein BDF14DRAFT_1823249 [Spinellus fusiger]
MGDVSSSPWIENDALRVKNRRERLSNEILAFKHYLNPTKKEQEKRSTIVERVKTVVQKNYPSETKIESFGSYVTGLLMPASDVDLNLTIHADSGDARKALSRIRKELLRGYYAWDELVFVRSARIPVLTINDRRSGTSLDITVNNPSVSSDRTITWLKKYPEVKPLYLTIKHAFSSIKIKNENMFDLMSSKNSGFASYTIICLIVYYIKTQLPKDLKATAPTYYADVLIGFLEYYTTFDFKRKCIDLVNEREALKSSNTAKSLRNEDVITVIDPDIQDTNVARSSSRIYETQFSMESILKTLKERMEEKATKHSGSILSSIIKVSSHDPKEMRPEGDLYKIKEYFIHYDNEEYDEDDYGVDYYNFDAYESHNSYLSAGGSRKRDHPSSYQESRRSLYEEDYTKKDDRKREKHTHYTNSKYSYRSREYKQEKGRYSGGSK